MYVFDRTFLEIPCPQCSYEVDTQYRLVLLEDFVFCPCCKIRIQFSDDQASGHRARQSIHYALAKFQKEIKNLNKTLTINI